MVITQPDLNTEQAIIAHLEGLTIANNRNLRNRDFSYVDGMTFDKLPRFADEAPGQRFTQAEAVYLGKMLCQAYPEYDPRIIDMVTTLGNGEKSVDLDKITKAHTFLTFERNGIRPGMTTNGVMIVRYTCKNGHWAIASYERMPGGNILGGTGI